MSNNTVALILTAGKGTRMKSKLIKNLHLLAGKPIIQYTIDAVKNAGANKIALIIGNDADKMQAVLGDEYSYIYQHEQLGTAHAVMQGEEFIKQHLSSTIMVILGDGPLFTSETLADMVQKHQQEQAFATLLTSIKDNPYGYGRVIRDAEGRVLYTVEEKDADETERQVKEVWTGLCCFEASALLESLAAIDNQNSQGEYYLPDAFKFLTQQGKKVIGVTVANDDETLNVNDRVALAAAEKHLIQKHMKSLMQNGVTIVSPETIHIEPSVKIGPDTIILPFTYLTGNSTIGTDCVIGPYTDMSDTEVADNVRVERSTVRQAKIDSGVLVGPFAYIRPGTHAYANSKVGQFVEIKNSNIGQRSKVPHLSYVGDTDIGEDVNLGAGTIVVNYDGYQKHRTKIGDNAFIGCNTNLVAPVVVGEGSVVAAGSTITQDVPKDALAVARSKQVNKEEWAARRRKLKGEKHK